MPVYKLVRAKLKPLDTNYTDEAPSTTTGQSEQSQTTKLSNSTSSLTNLTQTNPSYSCTLFTNSQQSFRNPIKHCNKPCQACRHLKTHTFVFSTTNKTRHPIDLPKPNDYHTCSTKNIVYPITCNQPGCYTQYVGYTSRSIKTRLLEHLTDPNYKHYTDTNHDKQHATIHILTKAPDSTTDKELWFKQQEYNSMDLQTGNAIQTIR